jgi:hypothetical protein
LLKYFKPIEIFSASMLPPAKRQRVRERWHEILLFMGEDKGAASGMSIDFEVAGEN